jgi:hypothetical protein
MNDNTIQQHQDIVLTPTLPHTMDSRKNMRLTPSQKSIMRYAVAGLCFLSEFIHLWLLPEQYEIYFVYGLIFLLIAMAQGVIGANLLFEPRRRLLTFGLWVNALTVVLYGFTHTIGVLVGLAFLPLPIDAWGVGATVAESVAVIVFLFLQRDMPRIRLSKERKGTVGPFFSTK